MGVQERRQHHGEHVLAHREELVEALAVLEEHELHRLVGVAGHIAGRRGPHASVPGKVARPGERKRLPHFTHLGVFSDPCKQQKCGQGLHADVERGGGVLEGIAGRVTAGE